MHLQHARPLGVHVVSLPFPEFVDLASISLYMIALLSLHSTVLLTYTLLYSSTILRTIPSFT